MSSSFGGRGANHKKIGTLRSRSQAEMKTELRLKYIGSREGEPVSPTLWVHDLAVRRRRGESYIVLLVG